MNDIFELSNEEKLARIDSALNLRNGNLAALRAEFEQQTQGIVDEIAHLEGLRNQLVAQETPAEEQATEENVEG